MNRGPSAYQPKALPLGQPGSRGGVCECQVFTWAWGTGLSGVPMRHNDSPVASLEVLGQLFVYGGSLASKDTSPHYLPLRRLTVTNNLTDASKLLELSSIKMHTVTIMCT